MGLGIKVIHTNELTRLSRMIGIQCSVNISVLGFGFPPSQMTVSLNDEWEPEQFFKIIHNTIIKYVPVNAQVATIKIVLIENQ